MHLTDIDIKEILVESRGSELADRICIENIDHSLLTTAGYDCRVGRHVRIGEDVYDLNSSGCVALQPGKMASIRTLEYIELPHNGSVSAIVQSKMSMLYKGLSPVSTVIHSDWKGTLDVIVFNHSDTPVLIAKGQPICTVVFFQNKSSSTSASGRSLQYLDDQSQSFVTSYKAASEIRRNLRYKQAAIIVSVSAVGLLLFGTTPAMAGTVALGVALSNVIVK